MLKQILAQLETLYQTYENGDAIGIHTHLYLEGEPVNFLFYQEDSKYSRLVTGPNFANWMAWCTGNYQTAGPMIDALSKPYGAYWDPLQGALILRFHRNELTLAEAVLRLQQAVSVVSCLESI